MGDSNNPNRIEELLGGFPGRSLYFPPYVSPSLLEQLPNSDPKAELHYDFNTQTTTIRIDNEPLTSFRFDEFNIGGSSNGFVLFRRFLNESLIRDENNLHSDQVRVSKVAGAAWQSTTDAIRQTFNDLNRNLTSSSSMVNPLHNVTCPHCQSGFVIVLPEPPKPRRRRQRRRPRGQDT